eukprot:CAMPEP_0206277854 /NCGR_PEP_ID=MMETSP0047_2-20121206/37093_1 /ASSEMBLY_ACC=CAM_ASM_000192 /TAXON_ID=195065 /ORGANISM="Chroomonas mesostigmatica_cf, Strain CCMP1168" /LENGTH=63 /DNA_ID=CAMNT_0053707529 /DNA_START=115 /DNA_END=303 /DNA_ORIENTATION=+
MSLDCCIVKRCVADLVLSVHVCPKCHELLYRVDLALEGRVMQRRVPEPLVVAHVDIDACDLDE